MKENLRFCSRPLGGMQKEERNEGFEGRLSSAGKDWTCSAGPQRSPGRTWRCVGCPRGFRLRPVLGGISAQVNP